MSQRIGDILVERGLMSEESLQRALEVQQETGKKLGQVLVEGSYINEDDLVEALSERLGIRSLSLENIVIDPELTKLFASDLARRYQLVPVVRLAKTLTVAMVDPLDVVAIDEIKYLTKLRINRVVASYSSVMTAIEELYSVKDSLNQALKDVAQQQPDSSDITLGDKSEDSLVGEAPVIKYVNLLIAQAIKNRASDIHIEPDEKSVRIRYRISGLLRHEGSPPKAIQSTLISRLKIMADVDVSEKRIPQDGRFTFNWGRYSVDVRLSTLPTIHGEKIVMRLLDRRNLIIGLENLGLSNVALTGFRDIVHKPEGLILICGPTGSGKTSTLYAVLDEINSIERNIITIEDPVEYNLPGINQVQTNEKAGLTFANCLRSILRQNPDVIMVGEIRDAETAAIAVRSAMTGHLVLSTIHTNDAAGAVTRLLDMGIESFLLSSSLLGVLAQRLVRVVCKNCTVADEIPTSLLQQLDVEPDDSAGFVRGAGCDECRQSGYQGRTGIFEFLPVTDRVRELILSNSSAGHIKREAIVEGMVTLHHDALSKALRGNTTYREVLRVSQRDEEVKPSSVNARPVSI
jgi:type IV pilus assembly protein PilB